MQIMEILSIRGNFELIECCRSFHRSSRNILKNNEDPIIPIILEN